MKRVNAMVLAVAMLLPATASAGWVDPQGHAIPDSDHMKSAGDLMVQLLVTDDEARFLENWSTPSGSVRLPTADSIELNRRLTAFVIFGGCAVDAAGNCDLRMQITVYQPDGGVYSELPEMEVWTGKPAPPNAALGLGKQYLRLVIEPEEPLGRYRIEAKITDEVSGGQLLLTAYFTAVDANAPASRDDFVREMAYFYLSPDPEAFAGLQQRAERFLPELEAAGNGADLLVAVMIAAISRQYGWPVSAGGFAARADELLAGETDLAKYVADDTQVDPAKLDIWWVSFSATGDEGYLEKLYQQAAMDPPREDSERALVVGAAKWSFRANCATHGRVLAFAERKLRNTLVSERQKNLLDECIAHAATERAEQAVSPGVEP